MKILSLTCNHCGAPLEVPAKARFVTCTFCSSRLKITQEGNAAFTELLETLQDTTREIQEDIQTIKNQSFVGGISRCLIHFVQDVL